MERLQFGCKIGVVASLKSNFILGVQAFHGNPYDFHTLKDSLFQAETLSKVPLKEVYVDQGYKGHGIKKSDVTIVN